MSFRSKLAVGFAAIVALLLTAASYLSLRNVHILSSRLRSSYADSVIPLRNAQLAAQAFHRMETQLLDAVINTGPGRSTALAQVEIERNNFEREFERYAEGATDEPAMQETLARYGALEDQNRRLQGALEGIKKDYPRLKTLVEEVAAQVHAGQQQAASDAYFRLVPLFSRIDSDIHELMTLEVEQGAYLDKESQSLALSADRQIPLIAGAAVALGMLLVLALARSVTVPLLRLTAAAQKVRAGDLDQGVVVESHDEVGQLALAFNTMTESLRTARADLERRVEARTRELAAANRLLNSQMAERERAALALAQAKDVAEAANRAKGEFLAKMSHEIRTPLNGVMGALDLTLQSDLRPRQREYLEMASNSADGLLRVINDILDFSRAQSGKLRFDSVDFNLRDNLADALALLSVRAEEKSLALAWHVAPAVPDVVVGDPGRLRQVVLNLVGNAIKFTERGAVTITVQQEQRTPEEATLHFVIEDTGIGIPAERQAAIFAPFEQADGSTTRKYGGTGLGLAISSQLVDVMGGSIWVVSEVGKGSAFHFTTRLGVSNSEEPKTSGNNLADLGGMRVLVVDDNPGDSHLIEQMLTRWGIRPRCVDSTQAAMLALTDASSPSTGAYQLLLVDCRMPGALALVEDHHRDSATATSTIMMVPDGHRWNLSGAGCIRMRPSFRSCINCADLAKCREIAVAGYVNKPIRQSQLLDAIVEARVTPMLSRERAAILQRPAPRLKILVAEDNLVNQKLAKGALEEWGHAVELASNGREALLKLDQQQYDLVLMDIQMPEMDGFEAAKTIREREGLTGGHIPIVAITAHAMEGDRERCLQAGMDSYVSKPLRLNELFDRIATVTSRTDPVRSPAASEDRIAAAPPDPGTAAQVSVGRGSLTDELRITFLSDTPRQLASLRTALRQTDSATVRDLAHYLKGSALYIGARRMAQLCQDVESCGRAGNLTLAEDAVHALETEAAHVCQVLQLDYNQERHDGGQQAHSNIAC